MLFFRSEVDENSAVFSESDVFDIEERMKSKVFFSKKIFSVKYLNENYD